jgi:hypothetical protein
MCMGEGADNEEKKLFVPSINIMLNMYQNKHITASNT